MKGHHVLFNLCYLFIGLLWGFHFFLDITIHKEQKLTSADDSSGKDWGKVIIIEVGLTCVTRLTSMLPKSLVIMDYHWMGLCYHFKYFFIYLRYICYLTTMIVKV